MGAAQDPVEAEEPQRRSPFGRLMGGADEATSLGAASAELASSAPLRESTVLYSNAYAQVTPLGGSRRQRGYRASREMLG